MGLVSSREGAQFTPAGVLRLPLPATENASAVLDFVRASIEALA